MGAWFYGEPLMVSHRWIAFGYQFGGFDRKVVCAPDTRPGPIPGADQVRTNRRGILPVGGDFGGEVKECPVIVSCQGLIHDLLEIVCRPLAAFNHGLNRGPDEDLLPGVSCAFLFGLDGAFPCFDFLFLGFGLFEAGFELGNACIDGGGHGWFPVDRDGVILAQVGRPDFTGRMTTSASRRKNGRAHLCKLCLRAVCDAKTQGKT